MCWNDGYERKRFEEKLKKQRKEYKALGMTDAEIDEVEKIDWEIYRSDRRFYTHTQPLEYEDSDFDNDDCNPLYSFFSKELSADVEPDYSNPYWWIEEIENPDLYDCIMGLPKHEKDLITYLVFQGYTQTELARDIFHVSDKTISIKVKRIREKLLPFRTEGGMQ